MQNYDRWLELKDTLSTFTLIDNQDSVIWVLDKSRKFTTKSLSRFLTDRGVTSKVVGYIWKCKDPLKIKFFLWQIFNNKLQVGQSLTKRRWHGSGNCCICGCPETVDHILFRCFLAKFIWSTIGEIWTLDSTPTSMMEFSSDWLQGREPMPAWLLMFIFEGFAWAL